MLAKSLPLKLALCVGAAIAALVLASSLFITTHVGGDFTQLNQSKLDNMTASAESSIKAYLAELKHAAQNLSAVFANTFPGEFQVDRTAEVQVGAYRVPTMLAGQEIVNNNYQQVDAFARATGGNATVFVRQDNDFVRVSTSVVKEDGSRAVGTLLDRASPAYTKVMQGERFTGPVELFGKAFITDYNPIKNARGEVIGIRYVGIEFSDSLQNLKQAFRNTSVGNSGYMYVISTRDNERFGKVLVHPDNLSATLPRETVQALLTNGATVQPLVMPGMSGTQITSAISVPELDWIVGTAIPENDFVAPVQALKNLMLMLTVMLIVGVGIALFFALRHMLDKPLEEIIQHMATMASGDYTQTIKTNRQDEVGKLQRALCMMQANAKRLVSEITDTAMTLASAAAQLSQSSSEVAQGSAEQNESATSMASTMEELNASIDSLSHNAEQARSLSQTANETSQQGAAVIGSASEAMQAVSLTVRDVSHEITGLGTLSEQISSIIQVIQEIADQTNLLALNAAIEAARAGEQGRGFAVVADEVRGLAARTSSSAQEITATIDQIQEGTNKAVATMVQGVEKVEHGSELAEQAGTSIQDIQAGSQQVLDVFTEISGMLREQALASADVARNVDTIANMTERNTSSVKEVATAAHDLQDLAKELNGLIAVFKIA